MTNQTIISRWGQKTFDEHQEEGCTIYDLSTCCGAPENEHAKEFCIGCREATGWMCEICESERENR
jgi:hypothetical protein